MKNIKKMLLGIALLLISAVGASFWMAGSIIGCVMFFSGLIIGGFFVVDGYLSTDGE